MTPENINNIPSASRTSQRYVSWDYVPRKAAFTLAEVLITLGVIGVVAALTLPTLLAKYQDKVLETQRKKAETILANGYKKMLADNEVFKITELPLYTSCLETMDLDCIKKEHKSVFVIMKDGVSGVDSWINLPEKYKDIDDTDLISPWQSGGVYTFVTPDGFVYGMDLEELSNTDSNNFRIYADVNGNKNPNTAGKDLVGFNISEDGRVYEVSDLACTPSNPSGCKTEEGCLSVRRCWTIGNNTYCSHSWSNGRCAANPF